MRIHNNPLLRLAIAVLSMTAVAAPLSAQTQGHEQEVEGVVRASDTGLPLAGATITVVGTGNGAITHGDGSFHIEGLPIGTFELRVERLGYRTVTVQVSVARETQTVEVVLVPAPVNLAGLVVTGSIAPRSADEALRPVNVLAAEDLQRRLQSTVAGTLEAEPGLAVVSMGPATAQPVVRGLSGDRVLMLEDGSRVGDVSNSGQDHATALDPSSARRIEVVRGPGAILYGSNALGGVINVIRDEVPSAVSHHTTGAFTLQGQTVSNLFGGNAHTRFALSDHIPVRVEVSGRTSGDLATPDGSLENTNAQSWNVSAGSSWVDEWGHIGAAMRYYANEYGIPGGFVGGHEEGVSVNMERVAVKTKGLFRSVPSPFEELSVDAGYTWYQHREIEPPNILGTQFNRENVSGEVLARHTGLGPFTSGAIGSRTSVEDFRFGGELSTPNATRTTLAFFAHEELELDAVRFEAGFRYDLARITPEQDDPNSEIGDIRERTFGAASGSLGMLLKATEGLTVGATVARAFRTPDITELFSEGPHLAAYAFEVGNPDLENETGLGVDVFARWQSARASGEVTVFRNDLSGYVFPRETGDTSRTRLPIYRHTGEDALLQGIETSLELALTDRLTVDGTASFVEGTLTRTDTPLPLMPPVQGRIGIGYRPTSWFVSGEVAIAGEQDRLGPFETPTDGYAVVDLSGGVRLTVNGRLNVITVSLDNLTDTRYRNHLSRVKEIMPEAGRGLSITYRVIF